MQLRSGIHHENYRIYSKKLSATRHQSFEQEENAIKLAGTPLLTLDLYNREKNREKLGREVKGGIAR